MLVLVLLTASGPAYGGERALPWSGGAAQVTPFEQRASAIASSLAGRTASVECVDPRGWMALATENGFDPAVTWAMTPLAPGVGGTARPGGSSILSPSACRPSAAFFAAPTEMGTRICRHGTTLRWTTVSGGARDRTVRRRVRSPVLGECDGWGSMLVAIHVLGHESMHLAGVVDEATADCLAMQLDALVAMQLGASATFARTLARDYWAQYYPAQEPAYRSPECRNGGALDLFRADGGWPSPHRYPDATEAALEPFGAS